jgi:HlyD family secretion protein
MNSRSTWRIVAGLTVAVLAGSVWWALREPAALVDVAVVSQGRMLLVINEDGFTRVSDIYTISAPIAGHLSRTELQEGDRVEAGATVIAAIHPLDPPLIDRRTEAELLAARDAARSGVGIAQSELDRAETALGLAEEELKRAVKLYGPGIISESALQKVTNEVALQRAGVAAAEAAVRFREAELASAEARVVQPTSISSGEAGCCVTLLAPITGTVLTIRARSEQAVAAGAVIAELGDTEKLEVVVDLLSEDAVRLQRGAHAEIVDWGGEFPLPAKVKKVDPAAFTKVSALGIEEQRVNAVLELAQTDSRLGHGFRVVARLVEWECKVCLQVPISSLFRVGEQWHVFRLQGTRLREIPVGIGRMNDETAQVLEGLEKGDLVVVHPSDALYDGAIAARRD